MTDMIHKFEAAGLGTAPFRYMGAQEIRGPITLKDGSQVGSPGQPMGTCDFCGQGIALCCSIRSADGKNFIVGSDCVAKVGDAGLKKVVKNEVTRIRRVAQVARESARIEKAIAAFATNRSLFAAEDHPRCFRDRATGAMLTLADQIDWMLANSGHAGKMRTTRGIEKFLAA